MNAYAQWRRADAARDFGLLLGALALSRLAWSEDVSNPVEVKIATPARSAVTIDA
jgi:hypothetical protein